jgi:hypothetical protein
METMINILKGTFIAVFSCITCLLWILAVIFIIVFTEGLHFV